MPACPPRTRDLVLRRVRGACTAAVLLALALLVAVPRETRAEDPESWSRVSGGLVARSIDCLRVTPKGDLLANVYGQGAMLSKDKGLTWTRVMKGVRPLPGNRDPVRITVDYGKGKATYLVTLGRVYRSEDPEQGWTPVTSGLTSYSLSGKQNAELVYEVAVDPDKPVRLLAGTRAEGDWHGGLYESSDAGGKWTQLAGSNLKLSRLGPEAWPILMKPGTDKDVLVGGRRGVWVSDDRGRKFKSVKVGEGLPDIRWMAGGIKGSRAAVLADARGVFISGKDGEEWEGDPSLPGDAIWVGMPADGRKRIYALLRGVGLVITSDVLGKKWGTAKHAELDLVELAFHPREDKTIYGLSRSGGLHVSSDDAATFKPVTGNLGTITPAVVAIAVNPKDGTHVTATDEGMVFSSANRGDSWASAGVPGQLVTALRSDPLGAIYATGRRLLKSTDNGTTWSTIYAPADAADTVADMQVGPDGRLWIVNERSLEVRSSSDGGTTWTVAGQMAKPGGLWATSLSVDARASETLLVGVRPAPRSEVDGGDEQGGALGSPDGGKTWFVLRGGLPTDTKNMPLRARSVLIDPLTGVLYLALQGYDVYARAPLSGADSKGADEPWVALKPDADLKLPVFHAFAVAADGGESRLAVYAHGEASRRAFVLARGSELKAALLAARDGKPLPENLWERRPDPRTVLGGFMADPVQPGRWVAGDMGEEGGVRILERPGGTPPAPGAAPAPAPAPAPEPARPPEGPKVEVPEGLLGFSASADFSVGAWNLRAGSPTYLRGHGGEVQGVAISPDGTLLASASKDKTVRLWSTSDLKPGQVFQVEAGVASLLFTADGKTLVAGLDDPGAVLVIDLGSQDVRRMEGHTGGVMAMALAADGRLLTVARDRTLRAWDLASGKPTALKVDLPVEPFSLAVWDEGQRVLVTGREPLLRAFSLADGKEVGTLALPDPMSSGLAVQAQGALLYAGGEGGVHVVDLAAMALKGKWAGPAKAVMSLALGGDGAWLLGGDEENGLWLWSTATGSVAWSRQGAHTGAVSGVVLGR